MNIVILGSGVIGVTTAWYLAQKGHNVTVIDRQTAVRKKPASVMPGKSLPVMPRRGAHRVFR